MAAVLIIGSIAYRRTKNATDFYLGGRRLSAGVAAMSACASDMGGWLLLGYPDMPTHILVRFKAIQSDGTIATARRIAVTWTGFTLAAAILVGMTGRAYLPIRRDNSENLSIVIVGSLFHPIIAGILLAAILSTILTEDLCPAVR